MLLRSGFVPYAYAAAAAPPPGLSSSGYDPSFVRGPQQFLENYLAASLNSPNIFQKPIELSEREWRMGGRESKNKERKNSYSPYYIYKVKRMFLQIFSSCFISDIELHNFKAILCIIIINCLVFF